MTRINGNIKPKDLLDKHLFAEYREMIRIPNHVFNNVNKINKSKIPKNFKLGTGHVTYYYNKLKFLHKRFLNVVDELKYRGYNNLSIDDQAFIRCRDTVNTMMYYNDISDEIELYNTNLLLVERLLERATIMKKLTINKQELSLEQYREILNLYV